jgi:homoserine kinase type II
MHALCGCRQAYLLFNLMAVFTEVPFQEASALMAELQLGHLNRLQGISAGIENTNYFADTDQGLYVLTIFERLSFEQLPFYLELMQHLSRRCIPVPMPHPNVQGQLIHVVQGKPAAVVDRLRGEHQLFPSSFHCERVGNMLARMHLAGQDFPGNQAHLRGLAWWQQTAPLITPFLSPDLAHLLALELTYQQHLAASAEFAQLPRGPIHADLFRDNVLFETTSLGEQLSGFFDFYFAGIDTLLFDLSVCLNDWCIDLHSGELALDRAQAMVAAYDAQRPLNPQELKLLPDLMRAAALRFWISRLWDKHLPRDAALLKAHDPAHFERVLRFRINQPWIYQRTQ